MTERQRNLLLGILGALLVIVGLLKAFVNGDPLPAPSPEPSAQVSSLPSGLPSGSPLPSPSPSISFVPSPSPSPSPSPTASISKLSGVWANEGGDKVTQDELRLSSGKPVVNSAWDGSTVKLKAARNEVVGFNLVLESVSGASNVQVAFNQIGPISSTGADPFNWTSRPIELFLLKYLQIKGLSKLSYDTYDERHVPKRMQRPWTGAGIGSGSWLSRPDHDKLYPEIAVPMETVPSFSIATGQSQSVWVDVYVPKSVASGTYAGAVTITEDNTALFGLLGSKSVRTVPVSLQVYGFALPDSPSAKTMVYSGYGDLEQRYLGVRYPGCNDSNDKASIAIRDKQFQIAHRHKLSMIEPNLSGCAWTTDAPRSEWLPRLNGALFTAASGYAGPGEGVGNDVFSIGTYGQWSWKSGVTAASMAQHAKAWDDWFKANSPSTERFLYLQDEPPATEYAKLESWASWAKPLKTFVTAPIDHFAQMPSVTISASWIPQAPTSWQALADARTASGKQYWFYNGKRPATGSFATEDEGTSPRQVAWAQYKKGVKRWFYWESTYYNDYQGARGQTDVFKTAQTFGGPPTANATLGMSGWNTTNGDGVLFYPGTDKVYPGSSLAINGPLASLRMKLWRRGIQDVDYIALAYAKSPAATLAIVNRMVPKALWEYGVTDASDPTWVRSDISWSTDPDKWEAARAELATIILN